jgi:DNA methyltransferase 1-associated protein 1
MTSADIREVLSISNTAPAQKKKKVKPLIDPAVKNATGITRELYSLLGEGTPPIAFIKQDRFKDKPKLNKKATPWYDVTTTILTCQAI